MRASGHAHHIHWTDYHHGPPGPRVVVKCRSWRLGHVGTHGAQSFTRVAILFERYFFETEPLSLDAAKIQAGTDGF